MEHDQVERFTRQGLDDLTEEIDQLLERLECELSDTREEANLALFKLHQTQEELERYFLENRRQVEKLDWLRQQRELMLQLLRNQISLQRRLMVAHRRMASCRR